MTQQRGEVVRGAEIGGLAWLRHQIDEIRLQSWGGGYRLRYSVDQQVRNHAGEERAGSERDQVRARHGLQRFRERLGAPGPERDSMDARLDRKSTRLNSSHVS